MDGPVMSNECLSQLRDGGTSAICGVQRAETVLALARRRGHRGRIYCVEANPITVRRLSQELKEHAGRITVLHAALCGSEGTSVEFHVNKVAVSSSLVRRKDTVQTCTVPSMTLRKLLDKTGHLDCLVMDIEGAEHGVIHGMGVADASQIQAICCELHPNLWPEPSVELVISDLEALGYDVTQGKSGHRPEVTAVRPAKRDQCWQRYFNPDHPCYGPLRARFAWVSERIEGPRFLDIGCSNGVGLLVASSRPGVDAIGGVDASGAMIAEARANLDSAGVSASLHKAGAERLPFADASFDTVFMGEVLEHVHDDAVALREAMRVLVPGGTIIITVPLGGHVTDEHRRTYSERSLASLAMGENVQGATWRVIPSGRAIPWLCFAGRKGGQRV